jgi:Flp pilus assembly protein TadD
MRVRTGQKTGAGIAQDITVYTSGYSGMKRMIFTSILFVSLILISGCVSQTVNPLPMTGPQPPAPGDSSVHSGGTAIAIAFKTDEISTTYPEAKELFLKGLTYSTQYARYNDSLAFFDAALAIDRNFSEAWVAKGVALHNMKRYDEAIENYDKALTFSPTDAGIWHVKGITLREWGKPEEAKECNRRAAEIDPRYGSRTT